MNKDQFGPIFEATFNKHRKLINEHYEDAERDELGMVKSEDVSYELVKTKDVLTKVIATVKGDMSGPFTKLIQKMTELAALEAEIIKINEEVKQTGAREKIAALFGEENQLVTRVVRTVSLFELFLTKNPKAAETTKWAEVYKELSEKLTPELVTVAKAIVKKHTKTNDPKPPSLSIDKIEPVSEGLADMGKSLIDTLKKWGSLFDRRLSSLTQKIEQLP